MTTESSNIENSSEDPFTIHLLNTYTNIFFPIMEKELNLNASELYEVSHEMHKTVVSRLDAEGIEYSSLRNALTPMRNRREVAFLFDSRLAGDSYGHELAKSWLPALRANGPKKTAIQYGDLIGLPTNVAWPALEKHLVGPKDFPRLSPELYYVVYITNLSDGQAHKIDAMLGASQGPYLGHVDCTIWNPLMVGMSLPQFGLRVDDVIIMSMDDECESNPSGLPIEDYGFTFLGIESYLYNTFLEFRLDQGVPEWAGEDAALSLNVLGSQKKSFHDLKIVIDESRINYLEREHADSLENAGLSGLSIKEVAEAIKMKISKGLIFNLRFLEGKRTDANGNKVLDPLLDTHAFTVKADISSISGKIYRYMIGMKYSPVTHIAEVTTIF